MSMTDHQNRFRETMHRLEEAHVEYALCLNELQTLTVEESWGGDRHRRPPPQKPVVAETKSRRPRWIAVWIRICS